MTKALDRGLTDIFRLTNAPQGLGLSCTPAGVSLAGVPLLRSTQVGFVARPAFEVAALMHAAYGDTPIRLQFRLDAIAEMLNRGDFAAAMIAAVHTRTPELSPEDAARLANAEQALTKYNYNPDEPRDWHGRWTKERPADQTIPVTLGVKNDQAANEISAMTNVAAIDDVMRGIAKNACIAECSESSLPTGDYGWKFVRCYNDCMRRHGYDPFAVRLS